MSDRLAVYVTRHALRWVLLCGIVVAGAALALDGLERASTLASRQVAIGDAAAYLVLRLATILHLLVPVTGGLAAALAVSTLRHRGEWDGMRALGAGPAVLRTPFLLLGLAATMALVLYEGYALPAAIERATAVEAVAVLGGHVRMGSGDGPRWWNLRDGVLIAGEVDPSGERLRDVTWLHRGEGESFTRRVDAAELVVRPTGWEALTVTDRSLDASSPSRVDTADRRALALEDLTPGGIRRRLLPRSQLALPALHAAADPESRFTLHARLAHPLAAGLLFLWAALLAAILPAGRALAAAAGTGLALAVTLAGMLGSALAPALGWPAWLPWVLPGVLAVAVYWTWKWEPSLRNQPLVQSA